MQVSWFKARQSCRSYGANLLSFETDKEFQAIISQLQSFDSSVDEDAQDYFDTFFWLAGNDLEEEGKYVWSGSNKPVKAGKWARTQSFNVYDEDCVHLYKVRGKYRMNDFTCDAHMYYICQTKRKCQIKKQPVSLKNPYAIFLL